MHSVYKHSIIRSLVLALDHRVCGEGNECPYPEASCHHESKKCICIYNLQPSTPDGRCKGKSNYWAKGTWLFIKEKLYILVRKKNKFGDSHMLKSFKIISS